jgi:hypothetical protein
MQKLILHFVQDLLHFNAPDQNPLDSIGFSVVGSCKMRVGGVEEHAGSSVLAQGRTIQGTLHPPASNAKYFVSRQPPSKSFSFDRLLIKILHFVQNHLHFDAADQNPLDLIGFPVIGSCSTPRR